MMGYCPRPSSRMMRSLWVVVVVVLSSANAGPPMRASDCLNGGRYVERDGTFICECAEANEFSAFAGHLCEHASTQSCEYGSDSRVSFCTNGGRCKKVVFNAALEGHQGCDCPTDDIVGRHCEYKLNDEPDYVWMRPTIKEKLDPDAMQETQNEKKLGQSGIIALVLFVCFGTLFVTSLAFLVYRRRAATKAVVTMPESVGDLEADGSVLQEALKHQQQVENAEKGGLLQQTLSDESKEGTWVGSPSTTSTSSTSKFRGSPISVTAGNLDPDGSATLSRAPAPPGSFAAATEPTECVPQRPSSQKAVAFAEPTASHQDARLPPRASPSPSRGAATTPGRVAPSPSRNVVNPSAGAPETLNSLQGAAATPSRGGVVVNASSQQGVPTPNRATAHNTPSRVNVNGAPTPSRGTAGVPTPSRGGATTSHTPSRGTVGTTGAAARTPSHGGVPPSPGNSLQPPRPAVTPARTAPSPSRALPQQQTASAPSPSAGRTVITPGRTSPSPSRSMVESNPFEEGGRKSPPNTTTSSYSPSSSKLNVNTSVPRRPPPAQVTPMSKHMVTDDADDFSNNPFLVADHENRGGGSFGMSGMQQASLPDEDDARVI